uniref:FAR1 domain-containing protein n=1 Tax=Aegilops tauschii subsp. strangulata TaxID=200361 RepID=A0A453EKR9_AEGTS
QSSTAANSRPVVPMLAKAPHPSITLPVPLMQPGSQEEQMVGVRQDIVLAGRTNSSTAATRQGASSSSVMHSVRPAPAAATAICRSRTCPITEENMEFCKSTNSAMGESIREPMTPRNMFTHDTGLEFVGVDKGEENCVTKDNPNASSKQIVPKKGMSFDSEEEAYKFYNVYAKSKGFSVRWTHRKARADDTLSARYLVCSKEGVKGKHSTHETRKERASTRTSCKARVQFHITPAGVWLIQKAVNEHNHHMVSPDIIYYIHSI